MFALDDRTGTIRFFSFQKLPESIPIAEAISADIMSSNPSRQVPSTPVVPSAPTKQDSATAGANASSASSDISLSTTSAFVYHLCMFVFKADRLATATLQPSRPGPPTSIQPKPQLSRADRRAIQVMIRTA